MNPVNDAPSAADDSVSTFAGQTITINASLNDTDVEGGIDPTSYQIVAFPVGATVVNNGDGTFDFSAATGGAYAFTYRFSDLDGAQSNVATVTIQVGDDTVDSIWFSTSGNVIGSGVDGQDSWLANEALQFGDPGFSLNPGTGTANGTVASVFDLQRFGTSADLTALHYVSADITVGTGANTFDLRAGDVLFAVDATSTLTSSNTMVTEVGDLAFFRPDVVGDFSSGSFGILLDGLGGGVNLKAITLVEQTTAVGANTFSQGSFLYGLAGDTNVRLFQPTGVGNLTTAGSTSIAFSATTLMFDGLELIEQTTDVGGVVLDAGTVLLSTTAPGAVGTGTIANVQAADIVAVTFNATGTVSNAQRLFHAADAGLDSASENVDALALVFSPSSLNTIQGTVFEDVDGDGNVLDDGAAVAGVAVSLYRDDGDGVVGATDLLMQTVATDGSGNYQFDRLANADYYVVVDSTTVSPNAGFNAGFGLSGRLGRTNLRCRWFIGF